MPSSLEKQTELGSHSVCFADLDSDLVVVATHPWGPLGGTLHNNVVRATTLFFQRLRISTVRFDFVGSQIGRGYQQVQQLTDILAGIREQRQSKPTRFLLVGYSYGSLIAASACVDTDGIIGYVGIAPPFGVMHWLLCFHSDAHLRRAAEPNIPRLFCLGSHDNFTGESLFRRILESKFPQATGAIVKDVDHFFHGREKDLLDVVGEWLVTIFPECQGDLRKLGGIR